MWSFVAPFFCPAEARKLAPPKISPPTKRSFSVVKCRFFWCFKTFFICLKLYKIIEALFYNVLVEEKSCLKDRFTRIQGYDGKLSGLLGHTWAYRYL